MIDPGRVADPGAWPILSSDSAPSGPTTPRPAVGFIGSRAMAADAAADVVGLAVPVAYPVSRHPFGHGTARNPDRRRRELPLLVATVFATIGR